MARAAFFNALCYGYILKFQTEDDKALALRLVADPILLSLRLMVTWEKTESAQHAECSPAQFKVSSYKQLRLKSVKPCSARFNLKNVS